GKISLPHRRWHSKRNTGKWNAILTGRNDIRPGAPCQHETSGSSGSAWSSRRPGALVDRRENRRGHGDVAAEPDLVHHLAWHSERDLFPEHRSGEYAISAVRGGRRERFLVQGRAGYRPGCEAPWVRHSRFSNREPVQAGTLRNP